MVVLSGIFACDVGREIFPEDEVGLGSQRRLYMHSAAAGQYLKVRKGWKTCRDDRRCRMSRRPSLRVTNSSWFQNQTSLTVFNQFLYPTLPWDE